MTITQELNQLEQAINQALTSHRQQLQLQEDRITSLTQLLNSRLDSSMDEHCQSAIKRLVDLLEAHQQSHQQVYNVLNSLQSVNSIENLTLNSQGEIATYLKLSLGQLAQRLGINSQTKLSKAAHNSVAWSTLMATHPDADGYQWQYPGIKFGFYHQTNLEVVGTKTVQLAPTSSPLN